MALKKLKRGDLARLSAGAARAWSPGNVCRHKGKLVQVVRLEWRAFVREVDSGKMRMAKLDQLYEDR